MLLGILTNSPTVACSPAGHCCNYCWRIRTDRTRLRLHNEENLRANRTDPCELLLCDHFLSHCVLSCDIILWWCDQVELNAQELYHKFIITGRICIELRVSSWIWIFPQLRPCFQLWCHFLEVELLYFLVVKRRFPSILFITWHGNYDFPTHKYKLLSVCVFLNIQLHSEAHLYRKLRKKGYGWEWVWLLGV